MQNIEQEDSTVVRGGEFPYIRRFEFTVPPAGALRGRAGVANFLSVRIDAVNRRFDPVGANPLGEQAKSAARVEHATQAADTFAAMRPRRRRPDRASISPGHIPVASARHKARQCGESFRADLASPLCLALRAIASDSAAMSSPVKAPTAWRKLAITILVWLAAMFTIGAILNRTAQAEFRGDQPAGFGLGLMHGALMPLALPRLAFGSDVTIYAVKNTGRTYNLGYTLGVNFCGAIFFSYSFWWYSRAWRQGREALGRSAT